jgi:ubiquinone/menaquinone biosynthesis C-methylase UbiE
MSSTEHQLVQRFFESQAWFWRDVYRGGDVFSGVVRRREAIALGWIDRLDIAQRASVLEVGCGAGGLALALARRGMSVQALDSAPAMVKLTRQRALDAGVDEQLRATEGDVHSLDYGDAVFEVVTALGVLPWLHLPDRALHEMARVLKPGGVMIFSSDNWAALDLFVDPLRNPFLSPIVHAAGQVLTRLGAKQDAQAHPHAVRRNDIERMLVDARLTRIHSTTCGFGTFTFFKKRALPHRVGLALDHGLQALVDGGVPVVRALGHHYMVLATKR